MLKGSFLLPNLLVHHCEIAEPDNRAIQLTANLIHYELSHHQAVVTRTAPHLQDVQLTKQSVALDEWPFSPRQEPKRHYRNVVSVRVWDPIFILRFADTEPVPHNGEGVANMVVGNCIDVGELRILL
ncbi:MAG TPA: hypothetical protein VNG12_12940 [Acidimicrobiales bacterium]|nr:hypothetical protein [Acidimicrobiales bacterium]